MITVMVFGIAVQCESPADAVLVARLAARTAPQATIDGVIAEPPAAAAVETVTLASATRTPAGLARCQGPQCGALFDPLPKTAGRFCSRLCWRRALLAWQPGVRAVDDDETAADLEELKASEPMPVHHDARTMTIEDQRTLILQALVNGPAFVSDLASRPEFAGLGTYLLHSRMQSLRVRGRVVSTPKGWQLVDMVPAGEVSPPATIGHPVDQTIDPDVDQQAAPPADPQPSGLPEAEPDDEDRSPAAERQRCPKCFRPFKSKHLDQVLCSDCMAKPAGGRRKTDRDGELEPVWNGTLDREGTAPSLVSSALGSQLADGQGGDGAPVRGAHRQKAR